MYLPNPNHQEMTQPTLNNTYTMKFSLNTYPTHNIFQWIPNFEPIFVQIPPKGGSVWTTPEDEETHSLEFRKPNTSTFNPSNIQKGIVHLSDDYDIDYGISDEEMARDCQDRTFQNNFKFLAAQEIIKFNPNLEGPKSKHQDVPIS